MPREIRDFNVRPVRLKDRPGAHYLKVRERNRSLKIGSPVDVFLDHRWQRGTVVEAPADAEHSATLWIALSEHL